MAKNFKLEMVTPEKIAFSADISELVVPAAEGYLGVLAGHAPLLCSLQAGEIKLRGEGGEKYFVTSGGFMEVSPEKTIILSETVEATDSIDLDRAEKALERARERLASPTSELDRGRAGAAKERAEARVKIGKKRK